MNKRKLILSIGLLILIIALCSLAVRFLTRSETLREYALRTEQIQEETEDKTDQ